VSCSAISNRTRVILRGVGLGTYSTGVVAGGAALCWVAIGLAFVALGGGAEGDVFGDGAFSVKNREAGGTKGLLGHLPNEGDDHGGSLFTLAAFRAGEPSWCLTHSEGRVVGLDFCSNSFRGGGGGDAVDDEVGPSLAYPRRGDGEFVEGLLKDGQVWFIDGAQELRRNHKNEVVGGSDVCQVKGWVLDVGVGGNGLVDCVGCPVGSLVAVVGCCFAAEDSEPVRRRIRLQKDRLFPGLLLTPDLCEFQWLLLCYLCVGWCRGCGGLLGGGWFRALLGWCQRAPGGYWDGCGGAACG